MKNMPPKKKFTFEIIDLIESVESKKCLWDKRCDEYKDRNLKDREWKEVCRSLEPKFDDMEKEEQKEIELMIIEKWKNIRDAFNKSLKKTTGDSAKKKYLYHDNLLFMLSIFQKDNTESSLADDTLLVTEDDGASEEMQTEGELSEEPRIAKVMEGRGIQQRRKKVKTMPDTEVDRALIKALEKSEPKYELPPDEDELFFKSLLPTVRTMNVDEKLQFRMDVLSIVQKIRQKKLNQQHYHSPLPSPQSSLHSITTHSNYDSSSSPQYVYQSTSGYPQQTYTQLQSPNDLL